MVVKEMGEKRDTSIAPDPYSAEWWQQRSAEELRDIIKHGFQLGGVYESAVAETERRARAATTRMRDEAASDFRRKARNRIVTLAAALAMFLASALWLWMVR